MTQELINKYFKSSLGQQCNELFSTPDDRVFIRFSEAKDHCTTNNLPVGGIEMWVEEELPSPEQMHNSVDLAIMTLITDHPEFQEENSTGWDMIQTLTHIRDSYKPITPIDSRK